MSAENKDMPPPYTHGNPPAPSYPQGNTQRFEQNPYHVGYDQPVTGPQGYYVQNAASAPGVVSSMNTVVVTQPQTQFVVVGQTRGSDLTIPSVLVCFFCCWITGIPAIIYAVLAQNYYGSGDYVRAESSQRCARGWIIASIITPIVAAVIIIIIWFTVLAAAVHTTEDSWKNTEDGIGKIAQDFTTLAPY